MEGETGIGSYRIDAEIAHSSICTIYKAWEPRLDRPVLIKKLHPQMSREEDIRKRFEREAQVCARVKHENIVDIYSYQVDENATMLVMEFVEGQSLGEMLTKRGRIEWRAWLSMLAGVLKGLAHAHSKGVTHRDVKPDNLLVTNDGRIKITDFGLAVIADSSRMTMQGAVVGTPAYLPPEQVSSGTFDHRGDLFSVGATFYEALTGVSPFSGSSFSETLKKILTYSPPAPSTLIPEVPADIDQVLARLLEKQASRRYASAEQALEDVKKIAAQKGVELESGAVKQALTDAGAIDRLPALTLRPPKRSWTHRAGVPLVAAAGLITLGLLLILPPGGQKERSDKVSSGFIAQIVKQTREAEALKKPAPASVDTIILPQKPPEPVSGGDEKTRPQPNKTEPVARREHEQPTGVTTTPTTPGRLVLTSKPWANVTIDNIPYGQTPLPKPPELTSGKHLVALTNPEFPVSFVETVEIKPGENTILDVNLWSLVGIVNIKSVKPWAEVFIDGVSYGMTPRARPIILPFGRHKVELRNPGYKTWHEDIELTPAQSNFDIAVTLLEK